MRIGICDDNEKDREMVIKWLSDKKDLNAHEFDSGERLLNFLMTHKLDILFLDCRMAGLSGIKTAQEIRKTDKDMVIIIMSNYEKYAVDGYLYSVHRFIVKPKFHKLIADAFASARALIENRAGASYQIKIGRETIPLSISDILYVESHDHRTIFHMRDGLTHSAYIKLDDVEGALEAHGFVRPHQSYLVSCRYIRRYREYELELGNGQKLRASRDKHKAAYDKLTLLTMGEQS